MWCYDIKLTFLLFLPAVNVTPPTDNTIIYFLQWPEQIKKQYHSHLFIFQSVFLAIKLSSR